jgi:hypothetical protein
MYWPGGVTPGWPSSDLANYNQWKAMTGRAPDLVRLYSTSPFASTGVTGSTGTYGMFSNDWVAIANDGAHLVVTFKDSAQMAGTRTWQGIADGLNAAGSNAVKNDYLVLIQNMKRWRDDTGNTALIKSIIFGFHHEPSNDPVSAGNDAAGYVAACQAIFNFFLDNGIGTGPQPTSGHGAAHTGTWYDMVEWAHVGIGYDMRTSAGNYAFYPGDGFVTWVFADIYGWGGGQSITGGTAATHAKAGQVPQPGDTITAGHYNDGWKTIQNVASNPMTWFTAGGSNRPVLFGLGEFAMSEDIDRFTISGGSLALPKTHVGVPLKKAEWYRGALKFLRGEAYTAPSNAENNITADPTGLNLTAVIHWNSQDAAPRWWNTIPYQTGDTTGPSTTGANAHAVYDAFNALVNDSIFSGTPIIHTAPVGDFVWAVQDGGGPGDMKFDATITGHDGAIVSYTWNPGDGSGNVVDSSALLTDEFLYSYATNGLFTATLDVVDANGLHLSVSHQVVVLPASTTYAKAPLIGPLDRIKAFRSTYNPAVLALEAYTRSRVTHIPVRHAAVTWTNQPVAVTEFNGATATRQYVDLTGLTQIKSVCNLSAAGATGAQLAPAYSLDGGTTWKWFNSSGAAGTAVSTTLLGAVCNADTVGIHQGTFAGIPTEAQVAGVLITLFGASGNATADPTYESIGLRLQ